MSLRSIVITIILAGMIAAVLIGRLRRHGPLPHRRRHVSSLLQRINSSVRDFDRLVERELQPTHPAPHLGDQPAGHPAPHE